MEQASNRLTARLNSSNQQSAERSIE
jgi:hypothetical protein